MKLSDFEYVLPAELIAQKPVHPRNHARLLIYRRDKKQIIDDYFFNLDKYLPPKTTLVINNSKVIKARFIFAGVEIFVLEAKDRFISRALVKPGKKFRAGSSASLMGLGIKTLAVDGEGIRTLRFSKPIDDPSLDKYRHVPLPPYIKQDDSLGRDYQTVYANPEGSVAAPTAGLHFTRSQLAAIKKRWPVAELTLHVGLGTFAPVKTENIRRHKMHPEYYELSAADAKILNAASHITAVGTTSARALESISRPFRPRSGQTDIFITPGYKFRNVDSLITNFHLPKSTLLMLVAALTGPDEMHRIYAHAIKNNYRFYSFGDAMLII